jgi:hypothetical protein
MVTGLGVGPEGYAGQQVGGGGGKKVQNEVEWRRIVREAKARPELYCRGRRRISSFCEVCTKL